MTTSNRTTPRTWWYIAAGFTAFWILCLVIVVPRLQPVVLNPGLGETADFNWTLTALDGKPVSFAKYKGKAVFLNIWATWCAPCVREMPSIARLAKNSRFAGKDIAFVCVAIDDSMEVVREYVDGKSWPMTVLHTRKVPLAFYSDGVPATFVIAPDGRIAATTVGASDWNDPEIVALLIRIADERRARAMTCSPAVRISAG